MFGNVKIADNQITGIIIGHSEINCYKSCEKHWNKLDTEENCPQCHGTPAKIKIDFNAELYVQDPTTEDIKPFLIFRRQMKMITSEDDESEINAKMNIADGKECTIDFDDQAKDDKILPKRVIVH